MAKVMTADRGPEPRTATLIAVIAAIGFAFDSYELLMLPLIVRPALMEMLRVPATGGRLDLAAVLHALAERGITRLMVEGGPILAASLISADLVDAAVLFRAPHAIGSDAIDALEGLPLAALTQSARLVSRASEPLGPDVMDVFERQA